jgi:hypothetical protein
MRHFLAALILGVFAAPAFACLNDQELPSHEREFRSQYRGSEPPTASSESTKHYLAYGLGGAMLVGAVAMTQIGRRG